MLRKIHNYLKRNVKLFVLLLVLVLLSMLSVVAIAKGLLSGPIGYAETEEGSHVTSAFIAACGIVSSCAAGALGRQLAETYERERDYRSLYASVLVPLKAMLTSIAGYMETEGARSCDLASYDARRSACLVKRQNLEQYADDLARLINELNSPIIDRRLAEQTGVLRMWVLNLNCISRDGRRLAGSVPTDAEALRVMRETINLIEAT